MKSDELKKLAESEENDLKAMGIYRKVVREENLERFEQYKVMLLKNGYDLTEFEDQGKIQIEPTKYGIIDYYPKANKVLIRNGNKWICNGLDFIILKLLCFNI